MKQSTKYIPTLDGWRALSVLGVILFHGREGFFPSYTFAAKIAVRGHLGVNIFFAISGFLICGLLLNELERTGTISLGSFYLRRCFRILPAYYGALAGICAAAIWAAVPVNFSDLPSCLFFYRNYMPLGEDYRGGFYTAHFWSLAVEEHFYLLAPLALLLLKPRRAGRTFLAVAAVVFAWRHCLPRVHPVSANFLSRTDTCIDGLLWGCLAAIYFPQIQRLCARIRFGQLWLPLGAVLLISEALHLRAIMAFYVILLPALVLSTVVQPASLLGRLLEWAPLRWIGTLSYSLYLWQMLFLPDPSMRAPGAFAELQRWPWNVVAIFVCAVGSRYLLELPMAHLGHRLASSGLRLQTPITIGGGGPERRAA